MLRQLVMLVRIQICIIIAYVLMAVNNLICVANATLCDHGFLLFLFSVFSVFSVYSVVHLVGHNHGIHGKHGEDAE